MNPDTFVQLSTTTGRANGKGWSATVSAFLVPSAATPFEGAEVFLSVAASGHGGPVRKSGGSTSEPAMVNTKMEIGGRWISQNFLLAEGAIVKVYAGSKEGHGWQPRMGSILLRVRASAGLTRVSARLPGGVPGAMATRTRADIFGHFDVITLAEARTLYGARLKPILMDTYEQEAVEDAFQITRITESSAPAPAASVAVAEVVVEEGQAPVPVARAVRRRRLHLD